MDYVQKHDTPIISATVAVGPAMLDDVKETTRPESHTELDLYDSNHSAVSTPNSTSPSNVSRTNRRKPRKSRVVANLGFRRR